MAVTLITGGAGFMGSHFVKYLLRTQPLETVVNLDALTYAGNLENLKEVEALPSYHFVKGDITDEALVEKVFAEFHPDTVINFAAETHVDRSILGPKHFVLTDVVGTYTLLEASKRHHVSRYIQVSTDEVYGTIDEGQFTEKSPFLPNSPYSASKAGADLLVRAYVQTYGFPAVRTHSCNVFGPLQFPEKMIPRFVTNLIEGRKVPLYGDGHHAREWIYVKDYCAALDTIRQKGKTGDVYNIGTGWRFSNKELTLKLLALFGKDESWIEPVADRLGHDDRYAVSCEKLQQLGWTPSENFDIHLETTVEWYRSHPDWWKPLIA
jgi:dTDP-glucose 4,6-dehydratase